MARLPCCIPFSADTSDLVYHILNRPPSSICIGTTNITTLHIDCLTNVAHFHVQEALKRKLKARMEYAKFLQDTAKEMAKEVQTSRSGETKQTAEDLDEFLNKVSLPALLYFRLSIPFKCIL